MTVRGSMDAEINNVIYMKPKMANGKYGKTNVAGSIDQDSSVVWLPGECLLPCVCKMYV
jgi:hypothetical protein